MIVDTTVLMTLDNDTEGAGAVCGPLRAKGGGSGAGPRPAAGLRRR